jgi:hypothetical protein
VIIRRIVDKTIAKFLSYIRAVEAVVVPELLPERWGYPRLATYESVDMSPWYLLERRNDLNRGRPGADDPYAFVFEVVSVLLVSLLSITSA